MREGLKILLLAGTQEARLLPNLLQKHMPDVQVIASFAGAVSQLPDLGVPTRVGGFGGPEGLADYCRSEEIDFLVDATHPFAAQISRNACHAARLVALPLFRLTRAPWAETDGDGWHRVGDLDAAASCLPAGSKPFIAVGRKEIKRFCHRSDLEAVVRMIERPTCSLPAGWSLQLSRPSKTSREEEAFFRTHGITHVVSKNSGGEASYAKIAAARALSLPVIMIDRPDLPQAIEFHDPSALCEAIAESG
ncbi:cobalt-precorrin-6A reductase [Roseibium sp.]|uniref:cobalt-precorrin-6A reductase n=1 Tax=Roseibium sp. TaxID=1936156 RepID=UPI003A985FF8